MEKKFGDKCTSPTPAWGCGKITKTSGLDRWLIMQSYAQAVNDTGLKLD